MITQIFDRLFYFSNLFIAKKEVEYKRFLFQEIDFNQKLISIIGAKGVGKTTLLHQYMKTLSLKPHELLYVSADNPVMSSTTILDVAEEFQKRGGKLLIIDEIHFQKNFEHDLKTIYDFFDIKVIFSGSSAIALNRADLSRRAIIHKLPILSFREFLYLNNSISIPPIPLDEILENHIQIAIDIIGMIKPFSLFSDYLAYGAYPFFIEGTDAFIPKLTEAINKTIESDLVQIYNIDPSSISAIKKILIMLCESVPVELNITKLSSLAGINSRTLYSYIYALDSAEILNVVGAKTRGATIVSKPDKVYLNNPNLFNALCSEPNIGTVRESFMSSMLKYDHKIKYPKSGDFIIDDKYTIEIGGAKKGFKQIKEIENSYVVADDMEIGVGNKIPLWIFGFLY